MTDDCVERLAQIHSRLKAFRAGSDPEEFQEELIEDGWIDEVHDFLSSAAEDVEFLLTLLRIQP
jgi:hypothetical protein